MLISNLNLSGEIPCNELISNLHVSGEISCKELISDIHVSGEIPCNSMSNSNVSDEFVLADRETCPVPTGRLSVTDTFSLPRAQSHSEWSELTGWASPRLRPIL